MGAGAYTVDINPVAEFVGPGTLVRRVVPIPPPQSSGTVKYGDVFVSLASNAPVTVNVTILTQTGTTPVGTVNVAPGRTSINHKFLTGDLAVDISFTVSPTAKYVTALVEYVTL